VRSVSAVRTSSAENGSSTSCKSGCTNPPVLASQLQLEADEILHLGEALQLLRFAQLSEGDLVLASTGREPRAAAIRFANGGAGSAAKYGAAGPIAAARGNARAADAAHSTNATSRQVATCLLPGWLRCRPVES
jgi:hypothetical protein